MISTRFLPVLRAWPLLAVCLAMFGRTGHSATLLFTRGIVHTVSGDTLTNASVLVRDTRIAAVGGPINEPVDTTVDLQGRHLYPGLISPTTVLGLVEIDAARATRDSTEVGDYSPDVHAWVAVNPDSELLPVARANGYTHAQAVPVGRVVSGHSSLITLSGWSVEDLAYQKRTALHVFWPSFTLDTTPKDRAPSPDRWKSLEDQVKERDKRLRELDEFFNEAEAYARVRDAAGLSSLPTQVPGDGSVRSSAPDTNGFNLVPAWEAMLPAIKRDEPVFLHADEFRQIRSAVEWGVRRKLRIVLAGGRDAWRLPEILATNHIPVAYEQLYQLPARDVDPYDVQFAAPAVLARAGVTVAFGGGLNRFGATALRNVPYAAAQAVAYGLSRDEALRGLTLHPAQLLGVSDRLGSIAQGKDATLFIADGDILDIRTNVQRMWIAGREVSLESRHTRLYERYRNRPKP